MNIRLFFVKCNFLEKCRNRMKIHTFNNNGQFSESYFGGASEDFNTNSALIFVSLVLSEVLGSILL